MSCPHLLIVGGVPCAGKSHFIERQSPALRELVGLAEAEGVDPLVVKIKGLAHEALDAGIPIVLHYDLFRNQVHLNHRPLDSVLPFVQRTTILTVLASQSTLVRRHDARLRSLCRAALNPVFLLDRTARDRVRRNVGLALLYRRPSALSRIHADWLRFGARVAGDHFVVLGEPSPVASLRPIDPRSAAQSLERGAGPQDLVKGVEGPA